MSNIITFYTATAPGNGVIQQLYQQYADSPPTGYSVLQHQNIDDLCQQVSSYGRNLKILEIIAHGSPYCLGIINTGTVAQLATALKSVLPTANVYLSGCNTGTWCANSNQFSIAAYLGMLAPCLVFGSQGYVDMGTYAKGDVHCSPNDWGQESLQYGGSLTAGGYKVFATRQRLPFQQYFAVYSPQTPISINDPKLPAATKSILTNIIGSCTAKPSQNISINPKSSPIFCISSGMNIYDFFVGDTSAIIRQEVNSYTWQMPIDADTQKALIAIANPQPATAVVAQPAATPKVQA